MKVRLRDFSTGKITATRELSPAGGNGLIGRFVFSPDGATLAGSISRGGMEANPEDVVFPWDIAALTGSGDGR